MTERIKAADLAATRARRAKRVEGAEQVVIDGERFHSKREARRWQQLLLLQAAGEIRDLERQVPIGLEGRDGPILTDSGQRQRQYVADFRYVDARTGAVVIEDAKGWPTEGYRIKRAILAAMGIQIEET